MSKEFEEIVLKKLENLETEVKQRFGSLEKEVKDTKRELQNVAKNTNKRLGSLETEVRSLETEVKNLETEVKSLETEVKDTGEVVKYLNNNFTKFDFEINRKIDTLFDANTVNKEKHDTFEEKIVSLEEKSFNHAIRISNLEDKVLTA